MSGEAVKSMARDLVVPAHSIYDYDAVTLATDIPKHRVGDKIVLGDGRVFHYAYNGTGAALAAGYLCQNAATVTGHWNMAGGVAAIGAMRIPITPTTTSFTKNQYANGYVWVNAGTGIGQFYKIKSHLAITHTSGVGYLELYDPLVVALDATSKLTVAPSPWAGTIVSAATATGFAVGIPLIIVPQSTATIWYYYWCQTWGPCCVLAGATQVIGTPRMTIGTGVTAGSVIVAAGHGIQDVGLLFNALQVTSAEHCGCFLRIAC